MDTKAGLFPKWCRRLCPAGIYFLLSVRLGEPARDILKAVLAALLVVLIAGPFKGKKGENPFVKAEGGASSLTDKGVAGAVALIAVLLTWLHVPAVSEGIGILLADVFLTTYILYAFDIADKNYRDFFRIMRENVPLPDGILKQPRRLTARRMFSDPVAEWNNSSLWHPVSKKYAYIENVGIQIREGGWRRDIVTVNPKNVSFDIHQGPLQRLFGLCDISFRCLNNGSPYGDGRKYIRNIKLTSAFDLEMRAEGKKK